MINRVKSWLWSLATGKVSIIYDCRITIIFKKRETVLKDREYFYYTLSFKYKQVLHGCMQEIKIYS